MEDHTVHCVVIFLGVYWLSLHATETGDKRRPDGPPWLVRRLYHFFLFYWLLERKKIKIWLSFVHGEVIISVTAKKSASLATIRLIDIEYPVSRAFFL